MDATWDEIQVALEGAARAHLAMKRIPAERRALLLGEIAAAIEGLGDELIATAASETALPAARLVSERARTTAQLRMFADVVRRGDWQGVVIEPGDPARQPPRPDLRKRRIAVGPVVVFGASNFPLAFSVAGGDTASALAAGCPVVVKAHPAHPRTSDLTAHAVSAAVARAGFPDSTFQLLHGARNEVSINLVRHPLTRAVAFTGSARAGRALFDAAATRPDPIPVFAEMGAINPVFLLPGALAGDRAALAEALAQSVTLGVGQFCTNPGVVVGVAGAEFTDFEHALARSLIARPAGTMLHSGICTAYRQGLDRLAAIRGVEVHGGATRDPADAAPALAVTTAAVFTERPELRDEVFGPVTLLVQAADPATMLAVARALPGQLTATIHGSEAELVAHAELVSELEERAGRLVFNGFPTGVEVSAAMQHGGPWPATTDSRWTSVGTAAIDRFLRPVAYQNFPMAALPAELLGERGAGSGERDDQLP